MPSLKSKLRSRREPWTDGHFLQLSCSHDFFHDAWGDLSQLPADDLPDVVRDMSLCWRQHQAEVRAEAHPGQPWFAAFAEVPQKLIAEVTAQREHSARYPHGENCRCGSCQLILVKGS